MHAPLDYECPFCQLLQRGDGPKDREIVYENEFVAVFPAKHQKLGNEGILLIIPRQHIENLYQLPIELAQPLLEATQRAANALKSVLSCDGITIRQNNEPSGGQDVWHYHVHVVPRYDGDKYVNAKFVLASEDVRFTLAKALKEAAT